MNISLTPELEQFVAQKVESGLYPSARDVILDGLRLLQEQDQSLQSDLAELRKEVAVGLEQIERGEYTVHDTASLGKLLEQVTGEGYKKLAQEKGAIPP